jgi:hypothetical protein
MTAAEFLALIAGRLQSAGIPFMIAGSHASSLHGHPRATNDVDLVIDTSRDQLDRFLTALGDDLYVSPDAARDALRARSQFNVIDFANGWKVDLIVRKDRPFSLSEFARRSSAHLAGADYPVASAEDVILSKLEWDLISPSERQLRDVLGILEVQRDRLDLSYLRHWAAELKVSDALEELLSKSADG